ncbi:hypothetical protein A9Q81_02790 [Gammaproteobacteria bacterium 42_54_T18]|nr:hypothetical protein A9Q81_02790 [Gammaproteobacteria bacterium 42_54_T18]
MYNFPIPYPDELIYSTLARYGVHLGITSPKQLLEEVYNDRKVIATVDLPSHLSSICKHLADCGRYNTESLAYRHTLLPLYAPFVPEERRKQCLQWMQGNSMGAVHLALGVAASRVKKVSALRYCPRCMEIQKQQFGEYYWRRIWQVKGANCCLEHGELLPAEVERYLHHWHHYFAASPEACPIVDLARPISESIDVTIQVERLLAQSPMLSASFSQWSIYYKELAADYGFCRGNHIKHAEIKEKVLNQWSVQWLVDHGLRIDDTDSNWLRSIFRKHRNSFSYLEHIVVLQALLSGSWNISTILDEVRLRNVPIRRIVAPTNIGVELSLQTEYRRCWGKLLRQYGTKISRRKGRGGAAYAWLYRHDREWLLALNGKYHDPIQCVNKRVDWKEKDRKIVRKLIVIRKDINEYREPSRMTRNWYLFQLESPSSIEKNLHKLPLCNMFFDRYCEEVSDYQIRRINRVVRELELKHLNAKRWRVMRLAGLSEERITMKAREYMMLIVGGNF